MKIPENPSACIAFLAESLASAAGLVAGHSGTSDVHS